MAQVKISELTNLTSIADNDVIAGVDTSANTTVKMPMSAVKQYVNAGNDSDINALKTRATNLETRATNLETRATKNEKDIEHVGHETANVSNELERVKNDILETGTASGTYLTLTDSTMAEFQELSIDGVCYQDAGTSYKNLLKDTNVNSGDDNLWVQFSTFDKETHTLTRSVTEAKEAFIEHRIRNIKSNTQYTVSLEAKSNGLVTSMDIFFYVTNGTLGVKSKTFILTQDYQKISFTFTTDSAVDYSNQVTLRFDNNGSKTPGQEAILTIRNVMLVEGTDTNYEPYPPSPDLKANISTINNKIDIISRNANIFDASYRNPSGYLYITNGTGSEKDGLFTLTATASDLYLWQVKNASGTYDAQIQGKLYEVPRNATTVYIKLTNPDMGNHYITFFDENKISLGYVSVRNNMATIPANAKYITARIGKADAVVGQTYKTRVMLSFSNTDFVDSLKSQITANIPSGEFVGKLNDNIKDTANIEYNEEDGEYHLVLNKKVGKFVLTGNESNWQTDVVNGKQRFMCLGLKNLGYNTQTTLVSLSTHYLNYSTSTYDWNNGYILRYISNANRIDIIHSSITTLPEFKAFLQTNQPEFYYNLGQPYKVDLGVVDMPISYDGVTNVLTDSDLLPMINATYYRNFKNTIKSIQDRLTALEGKVG